MKLDIHGNKNHFRDSLLPEGMDTQDIGSGENRWRSITVRDVTASSLTSSSLLTATNLTLTGELDWNFSGANGRVLARAIPSTAASGSFNVTALEPLNATDPRPNSHLHIGYNISAGPTLGPLKAGEPTYSIGFEGYFEGLGGESAIRFTECYLQYFNSAGVGPIRPWIARVNRATDAIDIVLRGDPIRVVDQSAQEIARFTTSGFVNVGSTAIGAVGSLMLEGVSQSPRSCRILFGTDNGGWQLNFSKRNGSTSTDLWTLNDSGHFQPITTNVFDIGASTKVVRNVYSTFGIFGGATATTTTSVHTPASTAGVSPLRIPHGSAPTSPVDGDMWSTTAGLFTRINGGTVGPLSAGGSTALDNLTGLGMVNGTDATNDIDIAVGAAASDDAVIANRILMSLTSGITKQLDAAWAVGTNQGGRDTGSIADNTWHVFLIERPDTSVVDVLYSLSATAPTLPANYTKQRRIGSILREAGSIVAFDQDGNLFQRKASILSINANNPGTSAVTRTLSVPTGIKVQALLGAGVSTNLVNVFIYLSDLAMNDEAPSGTAAPFMNVPNNGNTNGSQGAQAMIHTNTSGQIRSRLSASDASVTLRIATYGWLDRRGQG